jgi:hypothetical protein
VIYIPTAQLLADIFTKALPFDRFQLLCNLLGLVHMPAMNCMEVSDSVCWDCKSACDNVIKSYSTLVAIVVYYGIICLHDQQFPIYGWFSSTIMFFIMKYTHNKKIELFEYIL